MKIWIMESMLDRYKEYYLQKESDLKTIENAIDRGQKVGEWEPLKIKSFDEARGKSDSPYFWQYNNLLMLSERAKNTIANRYQDYLQFLPLVDIDDNSTYYISDVMNLLDGIDNNKSEFKKLLEVHVVGELSMY